MTPRENAEAHWRYVESLLRRHGEESAIVERCRFHYVEAFVHGYKHGVEDYQTELTERLTAAGNGA
jgi:hypothetical protein